MGLTVQPEVLRGLIGRPGFRGRGLLARFMYSLPVSLIGRCTVRPPGVQADVRAEYERHIRALLDKAQSDDGEPITLTLTPAARERLEALAIATESRLAEHGDLGHLADWGGKLVGMVVRVAGLLHLAERPEDAVAGTESISAQTVASAIRIGEYAVAHAHGAFAEMGLTRRSRTPATSGAGSRSSARTRSLSAISSRGSRAGSVASSYSNPFSECSKSTVTCALPRRQRSASGPGASPAQCTR